MTTEERKQLIDSIRTAITESIGGDPAKLKEKLAQFDTLASRMLDLEQKFVAGPSHIHGNGGGFNPFAAEAFTSRVKAVLDGMQNSGRVHLPTVNLSNITRLKSVLVTGAGNDSPGNVFPTVPQRGPTLPPVQRPLSLLDVFTRVPVGVNSYEFVQIVRTSAADVVAEGSQKPETSFETTLQTAGIATIAHWAQASRQVLSDNAQLSNLLSQILSFDVVEKYEYLLLNGNGTTDTINGLVTQAMSFSHTASHGPDRISECIAGMWADGFVASVAIMNPSDWSDFETERADSGDGQYVAGGWANPAAPSVWRLPVVRTPSLAVGTVLVVDGRFVQLLDREQAQTMISTEDRDNFVKNIVTLLAEMRAGCALLDTGAVQAVDIAST